MRAWRRLARSRGTTHDDRRTLLGAAAPAPLIWASAFGRAFADTPKDTVVMAHQIDDIISLDPQESFEFSGNEVCGNVYEKLISPDTKDPTKIRPQLAEKLGDLARTG